MSHTPGPWESSFKTAKTKNLGVYDPSGRLVASLDVHQLAQASVVERRKAEARLIAAAPELLSALRKARQAMLVEHGIRPDYGWDEFVHTEIDQAIAKATGADHD